MSKDLNSVTVIGNLTKDVEIRYTTSGVPVAKFSIANNQDYKSGDNQVKKVNFFDIIVWNQTAVICEKYLKKGHKVCISGELEYSSWDDKKDGTKKHKIEIKASHIQFLTPSGQNVNSGATNANGEGLQGDSNVANDPYSAESQDIQF
jgi:single-strand DNA-binding protein